MSLHDANMTSFTQWWRRTVRNGYAFAQGAYLHGAAPERHWVWESRRAALWGIVLPLVCLLMAATLGFWGLAIALIYPVQLLKQIIRNQGNLRERFDRAFFQLLGRFPESLGLVRFWLGRYRENRVQLIEYK